MKTDLLLKIYIAAKKEAKKKKAIKPIRTHYNGHSFG